MRLLSLTVRNYRVHKELSISFDPSRNLIGGPNETGKSTLAEAIHRALFMRAKAGGSIQKEMTSSIHHGDPEVSLHFEAGGVVWELGKKFAGTRGSTLLKGAGMPTLKDDEADARLSGILKAESGGRANASQLATTWSHLWVWQGSSGDDPSGHASVHKDTLVQRLQKDGIAAVMQSSTDQRVRENIATVYNELFTSTGKPKAGSKPEVAKARLAEAEQDLQRAKETSTRLEQAVSEHTRAEQEIAGVATVLPGLTDQLAVVEAQLVQVRDLRLEEEGRERSLQNAASAHEQISTNDAKIRGLHQEATASRIALAPAEEKQAALEMEEQAARATDQAAEKSHSQATDAARQARLHHSLATAVLTALEKSENHQRIAAQSRNADAIHQELSQVRTQLTQLPPLDKKVLENLRKLDREASHASIALQAMATGIELLESPTMVALDGESLASGETRILTDVGEITTGDGTRLRIRPGGGSSLSEARALATSSRGLFSETLARHTLRDLDHAATVFEQRQTLEQQISRLEDNWKSSGGDSLSKELDAATTALDVANADVRRKQAFLENDSLPPLPTTPAEARALLSSTQEELTHAEATESSSTRARQEIRAHLEKTGGTLRQHRDQIDNSRQSLRYLEKTIKVLEDTHGDTTTREASLSQAGQALRLAEADLAITREALTHLAPETLFADLDRFKRAISQQETRRREAEDRRTTARAHLTLDGSRDPQAELSHVLARREAARELSASEQRRSAAIAKLHQLFVDSRATIDHNLARPLSDRISGYLQCVFGAGTEVRLDLSDTGIGGIELVRAGDPAFGFSSLSGGAREQVAAAVRLAMAEILATDHDGCLPILFDDAFAYTDPERVRSLQRMLDRAAIRGLQVIVITCTPDDYSALGAASLSLA